MLNHSAGRIAAAKLKATDSSRRDEALLPVCSALLLAIVVLAGRIIAAW
jgi:hypothetical protein